MHPLLFNSYNSCFEQDRQSNARSSNQILSDSYYRDQYEVGGQNHYILSKPEFLQPCLACGCTCTGKNKVKEKWYLNISPINIIQFKFYRIYGIIKNKKCQNLIHIKTLLHPILNNGVHNKKSENTRKYFPKPSLTVIVQFIHLIYKYMKKQLSKRSILLKKLNSFK